MPKIRLNTIIYIAGSILFNFLVLGTVIYVNRSKVNLVKEQERLKVKLELNNVNEELNHVINDLLTLSESALLTQLWLDHEAKVKITKIIEDNYLKTITNNKVYDQIRLLDTSGNELIRVNYNYGMPEIIKAEQLQNKKSRYYFTDAMKLQKGNVYMSPIDLNIEHGSIEFPLKPMIRFATPVYDDHNTKQGVIIINYLAKHMLNQVSLANNNFEKTLMINANGYFIKGFVADEEWSFMFPENRQFTLSNYINSYQDSVLSKEKYQFETDLGLFTSNLINFDSRHLSHGRAKLNSNETEHQIVNKEKYWSIINFIPRQNLYQQFVSSLKWTLLALLILNGIGFVVYRRINAISMQKQYAFKELERSRNELKQINNTKDKLLSILAHDLINPFNSMMGFSEVLIRKYYKYDDAKRYELIRIISNGLSSTYQLLDNLLHWTKTQNGQINYKPKLINMHKLAVCVIEECKVQCESKEITVENNISEELQVFGDMYMITNIIRNLVSNAIKFSHKGESICIYADEKPTEFVISVKDNGVGMSADICEKIFSGATVNLVTQTGTNNEKGTGLGLSLCKGFIDYHKGNIWVESELGKGSVFNFTIPKNAINQ